MPCYRKIAAVYLSAAKYKSKREVKTEDGDTRIVYEYGPRQLKKRDKEKAKRLENLRKNIGDLRKKVRSDLDSKDPEKRLTALAVALIDETYERVGNPDSADEGHYGVTRWRAKHFDIKSNKATVSYIGKSGVKHEKEVTDPKVLSALRAALEEKSGDDFLFDFKDDGDDRSISANHVNEYLSDFDVTAKDLRGYHANREMQERLKAIRGDNGDLPEDKKERKEKLKKEFEEALEGASDAVGHESDTLRGSYLVPGLEDEFLDSGEVIDSLKAGVKSATKSVSEKEDEEIASLIKPAPKKKPPRYDRKQRKLKDSDPDTRSDVGVEGDSDMSLNYKRVARVFLTSRTGTAYRIARMFVSGSKADTPEAAKALFEAYKERHPDTEKTVDDFLSDDAKGDRGREDQTKDETRTRTETPKPRTPKIEKSEASVKALDSLPEGDREKAEESYQDTMDGLLGSEPVSDVSEFRSAMRAVSLPKDPKSMGAQLAKAEYAKAVVFNPKMAGGYPIVDSDSAMPSDDSFRKRSEDVFKQYSSMSKAEREQAVEALSDEMRNLDPESPRYQDIRAALNGIGLVSIQSGDPVSFPGRPEPSLQLQSLLRTTSKTPEGRSAVLSTDFLDRPMDRKSALTHIRAMSDKELMDVYAPDKGTREDDPIAQAILSGKVEDPDTGKSVPMTEKQKSRLREMAAIFAMDDIDTLSFVAKDAGTEEDTPEKIRERVSKALSTDRSRSPSVLSILQTEDRVGMRKLRMDRLNRAYKYFKDLLDPAQSLAMATLYSAVRSKDPGKLEVKTDPPLADA